MTKNKTLRFIGTVYGPLHYFLEVRYIGMVANVLILTLAFLFILSLLLGSINSSDSDYLINIKNLIIVISIELGILLFYVLFNLWIKKDKAIKNLVDEISAYSTIDIDSLTLRWKALYWGTLVLAEKYFLLIFIAIFSTTLALSILDKDFAVLGAELIEVFTLSFFLSLILARFLRYISLRSNVKRLKVSFFDTNDEIESRLFNLIKEPSRCLCIVDDSGNKHCGSLEGITYNVLIKDMGGTLVGIPYDHVYKVEGCRVKDDNAGSTLLSYL
jgi:hypothetical protein